MLMVLSLQLAVLFRLVHEVIWSLHVDVKDSLIAVLSDWLLTQRPTVMALI